MPPKLPDFANISERLRKALRLEHRIVVIGLSDTPPANLPHYEGEPLKACQMLDTVRFEGKSFYTVQNDHYECKNAIRWLGFDESYEGHFSGEWATGDYPDNGRALFRAPAFSRRMYEESPKVRVGTVKCAYYMPLEKANEGPARGDEVAIFVLNPRQAMYLARGTLYSRGGICYGMTGPGTCQSVIAGPFCTRQPMYSLGCFGARQFMKITGNEMWFGVPIEQLALLADEDNVLAWNSLGVCLASLGRHAEARRFFEEAIQRTPDDPALAYNLGAVCQSLHDNEAAAEHFRTCIRLSPSHLYALIRLGQLDEAEERLEEARALEVQGRLSDAREALLKAGEL